MPEQEVKLHEHPNPRFGTKRGRKLQAGDVIKATDFFTSTAGGWEEAEVVAGQTVQEGAGATFVRPWHDND